MWIESASALAAHCPRQAEPSLWKDEEHLKVSAKDTVLTLPWRPSGLPPSHVLAVLQGRDSIAGCPVGFTAAQWAAWHNGTRPTTPSGIPQLAGLRFAASPGQPIGRVLGHELANMSAIFIFNASAMQQGHF